MAAPKRKEKTMSESRNHKGGKGRAIRTEVPILGKRRLDAISGPFAIEVERAGTPQKINQALSRLKTLNNKRKILRVPQNDMDMAIEQVRKKNMHVIVTNLGETRRIKL
jgi:hypothetical protein